MCFFVRCTGASLGNIKLKKTESFMKQIINTALILVVLCMSNVAFAAKPKCYSSHGGYCKYVGPVSQVYVNAHGLILIYFDQAILTSDTGIAGLTITNGSAASFKISENPEFAKMFYSTALSAQASGRDISIQMRGTESGYLRFDRIWLSH